MPTLTNQQKQNYDTLVSDSPFVEQTNKAIGTDINTGTNDDKYVTCKAISESDIEFKEDVNDKLLDYLKIDDAISTYQNLSEKDQPNGYPGLDSLGKINPSELPDISYPVTSVFTRTCDVTAEASDYSTFYQSYVESDGVTGVVIPGIPGSDIANILTAPEGFMVVANDNSLGIDGNLATWHNGQMRIYWSASDVSTFVSTQLNAYQQTSQKNQNNGYPGLDGSGKINPSQIPALAITETFVVSSQSEMLALTAQVGDVAVRTDVSQSFILQGSDPAILSNWVLLQSPGDSVQSVFGRIGTVIPQSNDYTFSQIGSTPTTLSGYGITDAALDSTVVHKSGNETINGLKTFSSVISGSINGNSSTVTTIPALSGEVSNTGNAVTLNNSAVISKVLDGFSSNAGTVSATDSLLQSINKLDGNTSSARNQQFGNFRYVSGITGSNSNNGAFGKQWQTLDYAYSQITDASETNIYVIELDASSSYTCSGFKPNIILKANGSKIVTSLNIINFNDQNSYYVIQDAKIQFTSSPTLIDFSSKTNGVNTYLTFKNIEFLNGQNITITGSNGLGGLENVFCYNSFLFEAGTPNFTFNNVGWVYLEGNYIGTNVYNNSSTGERSVFLYSNYFDSAPVFKTTSTGIINGRVEGNTVLSAVTFDGAAIQGSGIKIGNSQIVAQPILLNGATYAPRGISEAIKVLLNPLNYTRNASASGLSIDSAESNFRGIDTALGLMAKLSGPQTFTGTQTFTSQIQGDITNSALATTATTATNVTLSSTASNTLFYLPFSPSSGAGSQALSINAGLNFNPSTGVLSATSFSGVVTPSAGSITLAMQAPLAANSLMGNITGAAATPTAVPTSTFIRSVVRRVFTASGTYTPTPGMKFAEFELQGAGGGGGGSVTASASQSSAAGGGMSGAYVRDVLTAAQVGASQVVTIASGASGGPAATNGSSAGASSVGTLLVANGGIGGFTSGIASNAFVRGPGGSGIVSATGTTAAAVILNGRTGEDGIGYGNASVGKGGDGASSKFEGLTSTGGYNSGGGTGTGFGNGGGGAGAGNGGGLGGAPGRPGYLVITEYIGT
jgi:hypothetical protein